MKYYTVITADDCIYCKMAIKLLYSKGETYVEVVKLNKSPFLRELLKLANFKTVPQVFTPDNKHLGGYQQLKEFLDGTTTAKAEDTTTEKG